MGKRVLITGGAGFIGSHVADELLAAGYQVRALDELSPQVHGPERARPAYLNADVDLQVGDVRDPGRLRRALDGVDAVIHCAAAVGVGQSMYRLVDYTSTNNLGTAALLEALIARPVERLVVASSMSVYGEGLYQDAAGQVTAAPPRPRAQLAARDWEVRDLAGRSLTPVPTPESKPVALASVYALSKLDQERMALLIGEAYGLPTVALRLFNVYGPRQALSNPYTGVLAIFAARLLNGRQPLLYEDGRQRRDFVGVRDVARACRLALERPAAVGQVINIGSGRARTVHDVALAIAEALGVRCTPIVTGRYRVGDVRHCFADIGRARALLGFEPTTGFAEGLVELAAWLAGQPAVDRVAEAGAELSERGLTL